MSQEPTTVTYSLKTVLVQPEQKIDNLQGDVADLNVGQAQIK